MVKTLYLIRHGETEGSEVKRYKGSMDVPLSEKGIGQIREVSKYIFQDCLNRSVSLRAVYTSALIRALKSAEIIAEPHGLRPIVIPDLRERSFGIWEGMTFDEIRNQYPKEFEAWAKDPLRHSPMGGESTIEVRDRVIDALEEIISRHQEEVIAIVAHGGVNRIILCHLLGIPLENIFRIEQDYGGVNIIEFHNGYPVVKLLNGGLCG